MPRRVPVAIAVVGLAAAAALGCGRPAATSGAPQPITALRSSPAGVWDGELTAPGTPATRMTLTLDSASAGRLRGTMRLSSVGREPVTLDSIANRGDSVVLFLPASVQRAVLRGRLAPDGRRLDGALARDTTVTFRLARAGTPEAAALVAVAARVEESRRAAAALVDTVDAVPRSDPDSAKLVTSDIPRFWKTVDAAPPESLAAYLQRDYLAAGSLGLRDFIRGRIISGEDLAAMVRFRRARYDSVRAANLDVTRAEPAIRAAFHRLEALYPAAVFPDVFFVIGRFNSGGTSTRHGLVIGAEMYRDPARLPGIVSHELIHFQQRYDRPTLLSQSFAEGTADFVGELISGSHINNPAHEYGLAHEHELWQEFQPHFDDRDFFPWMYGKPPDGRPNDLGYFIGYRIAEAYYARAADKQQALRDIITANGGDVKGLLAKSGYAP